MNRRDLIRSLLVAPFVKLLPATTLEKQYKHLTYSLGVKVPWDMVPLEMLPEVHPVIDIDLSLTGLQLAILTGEKAGFGKARKLLIGPELKFIARELLFHPSVECVCPHADVLVYEEVRSMPMYKWQLRFDRGVVTSGIYDLEEEKQRITAPL